MKWRTTSDIEGVFSLIMNYLWDSGNSFHIFLVIPNLMVSGQEVYMGGRGEGRTMYLTYYGLSFLELEKTGEGAPPTLTYILHVR